MAHTTDTSPDRLRRIDTILEQALDLDDSERAAFLERTCGDDRPLRTQVEALLIAADTPAASFDPPGTALAGGFGELLLQRIEGDPPLPGRIGPYRPTRLLGRGGMAVVYLAERADGQFEQEVAIKVIGGARPSRSALRLLERERQILASLEHPGIARLLDGGITDEGHPYLVMERIRGLPIDRHCDEHRLPLADRLRLWLDVARAVQHAHGRLVLHRDLKPANILVTAEGRVKLLDFGIAGLLDADPGPTPTLTAAGLMTPEYASPEQAAGRPMTTASDVYQLGLLLYRLLTGCPPYRIDTRSPIHTERAIRETSPVRPSSRLIRGPLDPEEADEWSPATAAAARGERVASLARRLRGDLDDIVLMALRKEPERRYLSAEAFAQDVENHLAGRPVTAHADSLGYRLRKLVSRHRVAAAALVAAMAFGTYHLAVVQAQNRIVTAERDRARIEARRASEIRTFLVDLFEGADPGRSAGRDVTVRELVDQGAIRLRSELGDQPEVRAEMLGTIGDLYRTLGLYDEAETQLRDAVEQVGAGPLRAEILARLARLRAEQSHREEAVELYREALGLAAREAPDDELLRAALLHELGTVQISLDDTEAGVALREALEIRRRRLGPGDEAVAETLNSLADLERQRGRMPAALELFRQALEIRERRLAPPHPSLAQSWTALGSLLGELGRADEAIELLERAADAWSTILGPRHPYTATALTNLGHAYRQSGQPETAEGLFRDALEIDREALGPGHRSIARLHNALGLVLEDQEKWEAAEAEYETALALYQPGDGSEDATRFNLASVRREKGDIEAATRDLRALLDRFRTERGTAHWTTAHTSAELGLARLQAGDAAAAVRHFEEARTAYAAVYGPDSLQQARGAALLGRALVERGDLEAAESALQAAYERFHDAEEPTTNSLAFTRLGLGWLRLAQGRREEAVDLARAAAEVYGEERGFYGRDVRDLLAELEE